MNAWNAGEANASERLPAVTINVSRNGCWRCLPRRLTLERLLNTWAAARVTAATAEEL